ADVVFQLRQRPHRRFDVEAAHLAGDVRVDAGGALLEIVDRVGAVDVDLRELAADAERAAVIAAVELDQADVRLHALEVEAGFAAPEARAHREAGITDVFEPPGAGDVADVRAEPLLFRLGEPVLRGDLGRVERRHEIRAVLPAAAESAVDAGAGVEPRGRDDNGVDERPLDAEKRRRLVTLVDDADRREEHAGAEVHLRLEAEVEVRLLDLELARFFEPFDEAVLDLDLANEPQPLGEGVVEQQHEAMEVELGIL